jgi:hypothetical protein
MCNVEMDEKRSLWNRILGLLEEDLVQRRTAKVFVRVRDESGIHLKEVSDLSIPERQSLDPGLRDYVVEQLLDRYLAEQGNVDLVKNRRHYTKRIQDITPQDLPALVEAERCKADVRVMCLIPAAHYAQSTQQRRKEKGHGPLV